MIAYLLAVWLVAAPEEATTAASVRFERGVELFEARDFAASLAEFEAAYALTHRFEVLFNMGVTQRELFRYGEAIATLEAYLTEGGDRISEDRKGAVRETIRGMKAVVAEVEVIVEGEPATVELDGRTVGVSPFPGPLLIGPGAHVLRATREGATPAESRIQVVSGERARVVLSPISMADPPKKEGLLRLTTNPDGARVRIDGEVVGNTPLERAIVEGGHEVRVELEGFEAQQLEAVLAAGQTRDLHFELLPVEAPAPWYFRWYSVVGVAAVIGALGVGTFVLIESNREKPDFVIHYP